MTAKLHLEDNTEEFAISYRRPLCVFPPLLVREREESRGLPRVKMALDVCNRHDFL